MRKAILVTTFERVLLVTLTPTYEVARVRVVHEGRGIYFGIARHGRRLWIVERNLDINKAQRTAKAPVNGIAGWWCPWIGPLRRTGPTVTHPDFDDLHQIAWDEGALFVTTGHTPFLVRHDVRTGKTTDVPVEDLLPDHLRCIEGVNPDKYHINSVAVTGNRLWVLAHNWDRPSFAVGMDLAAARTGRAEASEIIEDLGSCCHDVLPAFGALWVLDSGGAALVRVGTDGQMRYSVDGEGGKPFPRGLAQVDDRLVLAYGSWADEREARINSVSFLRVFDPVSAVMGPPISLGYHGNTCAVLAI